jgi:hypothetical protein
VGVTKKIAETAVEDGVGAGAGAEDGDGDGGGASVAQPEQEEIPSTVRGPAAALPSTAPSNTRHAVDFISLAKEKLVSALGESSLACDDADVEALASEMLARSFGLSTVSVLSRSVTTVESVLSAVSLAMTGGLEHSRCLHAQLKAQTGPLQYSCTGEGVVELVVALLANSLRYTFVLWRFESPTGAMMSRCTSSREIAGAPRSEPTLGRILLVRHSRGVEAMVPIGLDGQLNSLAIRCITCVSGDVQQVVFHHPFQSVSLRSDKRTQALHRCLNEYLGWVFFVFF